MLAEVDSNDIIGYVGGAILSIQNIPQLVRIIRRRSAKDLSYTMLALFFLGSTLTIVYGINIGAVPLFAPLCFSVFVNVLIASVKLYFDSRAVEQDTIL